MQIEIPVKYYGQVSGTHATSIATARATSTGFANNTAHVGQLRITTPVALYGVYRIFLSFDTSILQDALVSQVNLRMQCNTDNSATNFNVQIVEQDWSASDPITNGNRETVYDACLAAASSILWRSTSGISLNTDYDSANLTTSRIAKNGITYFSLRSSRDKAANTPTGLEDIFLTNIRLVVQTTTFMTPQVIFI